MPRELRNRALGDLEKCTSYQSCSPPQLVESELPPSSARRIGADPKRGPARLVPRSKCGHPGGYIPQRDISPSAALTNPARLRPPASKILLAREIVRSGRTCCLSWERCTSASPLQDDIPVLQPPQLSHGCFSIYRKRCVSDYMCGA